MQRFTIEGFGNLMELLSCQNSKFFAISFVRYTNGPGEARRPHACITPCAFEKKKRKKITSESRRNQRDTIKTTAARRPLQPRDGSVTQRVPHVSPCPPASSVDTDFVEIDHVLLSPSTILRTKGDRQQYTNRQRDRFNMADYN